MKRNYNRSGVIRNALSLLLLGGFILTIYATSIGPRRETTRLPDGKIEETIFFDDESNTQRVITGKKGRYNQWEGPILIEQYVDGYRFQFSEKVNMYRGYKNGMAIRTWPTRVDTVCYEMGVERPCVLEIDSDWRMRKIKNENDNLAFEILSNKQSFLQATLIAAGFEDDLLFAYLDTVELLLNQNLFVIEDFDQHYADIMDTLEQTHYYDLMQLNSQFSVVKGLEGLKNSEFRMAVIDHYYSEADPTFYIIENKYSNYLQLINDEGIPTPDFNLFCIELDSLMNTYEPALDQGDPFFVDSIDSRLYMALTEIVNGGNSSKKSIRNVGFRNNSSYINEVIKLFSDRFEEKYLPNTRASSSDIAIVVLSLMLQDFNTADDMKNVVKQSHCITNKIVQPPVIVTEFAGSDSKNSAVLAAYLIDDGGGEISEKGIVWAEIYNPNLGNNKESVSTSDNEFSVTVNDLSEGITYFARAYAINSADTTYGNCIDFMGGSSLGLEPPLSNDLQVKLFPNPAMNKIFLNFKSPGEYRLMILDPAGHILQSERSFKVNGQIEHVELNVNQLKSGVYYIEILDKDKNRIVKKLLKL